MEEHIHKTENQDSLKFKLTAKGLVLYDLKLYGDFSKEGELDRMFKVKNEVEGRLSIDS